MRNLIFVIIGLFSLTACVNTPVQDNIDLTVIDPNTINNPTKVFLYRKHTSPKNEPAYFKLDGQYYAKINNGEVKEFTIPSGPRFLEITWQDHVRAPRIKANTSIYGNETYYMVLTSQDAKYAGGYDYLRLNRIDKLEWFSHINEIYDADVISQQEREEYRTALLNETHKLIVNDAKMSTPENDRLPYGVKRKLSDQLERLYVRLTPSQSNGFKVFDKVSDKLNKHDVIERLGEPDYQEADYLSYDIFDYGEDFPSGFIVFRFSNQALYKTLYYSSDNKW